jgi:F-type H+-transporting ATPase subunit delta
MAEAGNRPGQDVIQAARPETVLDPSTSRIARVYAEAIFRAADNRQQIDGLLEELDSLTKDVFKADPQFEAFLYSTAVGRDQKREVIESVFENTASELFVNALMVLNAHERLSLLRSIVAEYEELRDEHGGLVRVIVRTPVPLSDDQRERLGHELQESLRKTPRIESQVDPELLGGMVLSVGDWVYDFSVRTQLDEIRNHLLTRSSYEIQSRRDRFCSANGD